MRRRLYLTYLVLIGALLLALAVPLGLAYAQKRTNELLLDRRADATRFAELTDQAVREGEPAEGGDGDGGAGAGGGADPPGLGASAAAGTSDLAAEALRYATLYGAGLQVRDGAGSVLVTAGGHLGGRRAAAEVRRALAGRTTARLPLVTPFGPRHAVVAEPAGRDAQVIGTVLLVAPTRAARRDIALVWLALGAGAAAAFAGAAFAARALARWTLRPVAELDAATEALAAGQLHARAPVSGRGPSELRRLEQRFNAMADVVAAALDRQRAFVADASHELRTPLAVLSLRLENLQPELRSPDSEEYARALEEIDRLGALLDDLLALARIESAAQVAAGPVDVVGELRPRLEAWAEVAAAGGVELAAGLPERLTVFCILDTVGRIADIALDNAVKFVPRGGHVGVTLSRAGGEAVLRVADDGPGLAPDERAAARGRFWRSPRHSNTEGSGLGLAIADELARAAGGTLALLPAEPHGLVVELRLPLGDSADGGR
ncbi:HAMP domain-containing sensor histidine kinase [Streptomyces sp. B1866]|uniref:sensor histidine kinase n=1 Tax=Streptomyces sp. B1866 TaxID=3075431 RepID=UPI00288C8897|nr:HAMP domain-containing sensor histidine kinase [Streptomyces sp. B1866]MDT3395369.1 HAMP domain-containing sensor histidine kinase [Streptomyces sp. B1866]